MRLRFALYFFLLTLGFNIQAQEDFSEFNTWSVFTNPVRPFTGIADINIHVPVSPNSALIVGGHHYSFFYVYERGSSPGLFQIYDEAGYIEWIRTNVISADYRIYRKLKTRKRSGKVVAKYATLLNRFAIVDVNYTDDMIENPLFEDPFIMLWRDPFSEPEYIPASYDNLKRANSLGYRMGLEFGRRYWKWDHSQFYEYGFALMVTTQPRVFPVLQFRAGL